MHLLLSLDPLRGEKLHILHLFVETLIKEAGRGARKKHLFNTVVILQRNHFQTKIYKINVHMEKLKVLSATSRTTLTTHLEICT